MSVSFKQFPFSALPLHRLAPHRPRHQSQAASQIRLAARQTDVSCHVTDVPNMSSLSITVAVRIRFSPVCLFVHPFALTPSLPSSLLPSFLPFLLQSLRSGGSAANVLLHSVCWCERACGLVCVRLHRHRRYTVSGKDVAAVVADGDGSDREHAGGAISMPVMLKP